MGFFASLYMQEGKCDMYFAIIKFLYSIILIVGVPYFAQLLGISAHHEKNEAQNMV